MKKVLITDKEKAEIAMNLDSKPKLKKLIRAAGTLTPDDLNKVVQFVNERR